MTPKTQIERFSESTRTLETAEDQEQIGRALLCHFEKLRALRTEIDKGLRSLDAGQARESSIDDFLRQKNR